MDRSHYLILRSMLFTPGLKPERFDAAQKAGADMICIDLEDSVAPELKSQARKLALDYLRRPAVSDLLRGLRINSVRTAYGIHDLHALLEERVKPDLLVLPKTQTAEDVAIVAEALSGEMDSIGFMPIIESPEGLSNVDSIATAPRVRALLFGGADMAAALGVALGWNAMLYSRSRIAQAAARAQIVALDVPFMDIKDTDGLRHETEAAAELGLGGKAAIHPAQIAVINQVYVPSEQRVAQARRVVAAYDSNPSGVCVVDGRMVDLPIVDAARRTVALVERLAARATGA